MFEETDCFVPRPPGATAADVRCGYVGVPLERDDPDGPATRLAVAIRRATGPDRQDDPRLMLAGGPGEHLVVGFPALLADGGPFSAINAHRDVILLDQHGVGFSEPTLACPETPSTPGRSRSDATLVALVDRVTGRVRRAGGWDGP